MEWASPHLPPTLVTPLDCSTSGTPVDTVSANENVLLAANRLLKKQVRRLSHTPAHPAPYCPPPFTHSHNWLTNRLGLRTSALCCAPQVAVAPVVDSNNRIVGELVLSAVLQWLLSAAVASVNGAQDSVSRRFTCLPLVSSFRRGQCLSTLRAPCASLALSLSLSPHIAPSHSVRPCVRQLPRSQRRSQRPPCWSGCGPVAFPGSRPPCWPQWTALPRQGGLSARGSHGEGPLLPCHTLSALA